MYTEIISHALLLQPDVAHCHSVSLDITWMEGVKESAQETEGIKVIWLSHVHAQNSSLQPTGSARAPDKAIRIL
jgi:hypothetical protein